MADVRPDPAAPPGAYERSDMNLRVVGLALLGLTGGVGIALALTVWLFDVFDAGAVRRDAPPSPLAVGRPLPPEPRLLASPGRDLRTMRAAEDAVLSSYGWVDREAGLVRIPIDRAMDLLAQRGLPARGGGAKTPRAGATR